MSTLKFIASANTHSSDSKHPQRAVRRRLRPKKAWKKLPGKLCSSEARRTEPEELHATKACVLKSLQEGKVFTHCLINSCSMAHVALRTISASCPAVGQEGGIRLSVK